MISSRASARCSVVSLALWALSLGPAAAEDAGATARPAAASTGTTRGDAGAPKPEAAVAIDATGLLRAFSGMPGLEARFREEKRIALLARPLTSEGRLFFTHPGLLLRRVE